jgi:hypothetical protein
MDITATNPLFEPELIRRALIGFCGANQNALLHYLAFTADLENETTEELAEFQTAIMEWLDYVDGPPAPPVSLIERLADPTSGTDYEAQTA